MLLASIAAGMLLTAGMLADTAGANVGVAAGGPADTAAMDAGAEMPFMAGCCAERGRCEAGRRGRGHRVWHGGLQHCS